MFSKLVEPLLLRTSMIIFLIVGCSGENKPYRGNTLSIKFDQFQSQCLRNGSHTVTAYMNGHLASVEINQFWDCIQESLDSFVRFTRGGRQVGAYSSKEIRNFFHTFFMGDLRINDELLEELMEVKQVILSGSREFVTHEELVWIREIVENFRQLTLSLSPHLQVIQAESYQEQESYSMEELDQSLNTLLEFFVRFAKVIEKSGQAYELSRFEKLLVEIGKFSDGQGHHSYISLVRDVVFLISQVKMQLVGSPADRIQPDQWTRMVMIFGESARFWLWHQYFDARKSWYKDPHMFEQMFAAMQSAALRLGQVLSQTDQSLDWPKVNQLVKGVGQVVQKYYRSDVEINDFLVYLHVFSELKTHLVGEPQDKIIPSDWPALLIAAARFSEMGLRYIYLVKPNYWDRGVGLEHLDKAVTTGLELFSESVNRQPEKKIGFDELNKIVSAMEKAHLIPLGIRAASISESMPAITNRLMRSPKDRMEGGEIDGIDSKTFVYLRHRWQSWKKMQDNINHMNINRADSEKLQPAASHLDLTDLMSGPFPLVHDQKGRLIFDQPGRMKWTQSSLTQLNWFRSLLNLFAAGYAENEEGRMNQLTSLNINELDLLASDFFPIGVDIGLFSEEEEGSGTIDSIFFYSDALMPRSNGNERVDLAEAVEYLTYILSGSAAGREFVHQLPASCIVKGEEEEEEEEVVKLDCFRKAMAKGRQNHMDHMPLFNLYADTLSPEAWNSLQQSLELLVRGRVSDELTIGMEKIKRAFVFLQLVETFFIRYNQDQELWFLNVNEVLSAFPTFDLLLLNLSGFAERDDREALFTYMLKNGSPPQQDLNGLNEFQEWKVLKPEWAFEVDRVGVIRLLAELSESI